MPKRAARGSGTIRQRKDGTWEARFTVGRDPGTGKQKQKSVYGKTQKEVRQKMTAAQAEIDKGEYIAPDHITVKKFMESWYNNFCAGRLKPYTAQTYRRIIDKDIVPHIGALDVQKLNGSQIQTLCNNLSKSGLSPKSVRNILSVLHKALDKAFKLKMIAHNPCDVVDLPEQVKPEINPLTDAEISAFITAVKGNTMEAAYMLCLLCGMREGECLGLSWRQVDFESHTIIIDQQLQREKNKGGQYYIQRNTKNGKSRVIQPPAIAFDYLKAEKKKQAERQLAAGELWSNPDNLVFTNDLGRHYMIITFYKEFKRLVSRIGRPDARPHDLRHTAATVAIASGADIKSVQNLLGHSTASFTLNTYVHASQKLMEDTANRIDAYYKGISSL